VSAQHLAVDQSASPALSMIGATKVYGAGPNAVTALRGVTLSVQGGTFSAVMGPSGSGKSTFLQCAAGLDRVTQGRVFLAGADLGGLDETRLTRLRRRRVGFVFQAYNLVPALSLWDNVVLPLRLDGQAPDRDWVVHVLSRLGLGDRLRHRPAELSGGQQQRVAIARALATRPEIIFADEPTGALDARTGSEILALLRAAVDEYRQTIIMVTHDPVAASHADRVIFLADGQLVGHLDHPTAAGVATRMTGLEG
jgi:putative ABC transport system ATP-binding protein